MCLAGSLAAMTLCFKRLFQSYKQGLEVVSALMESGLFFVFFSLSLLKLKTFKTIAINDNTTHLQEIIFNNC